MTVYFLEQTFKSSHDVIHILSTTRQQWSRCVESPTVSCPIFFIFLQSSTEDIPFPFLCISYKLLYYRIICNVLSMKFIKLIDVLWNLFIKTTQGRQCKWSQWAVSLDTKDTLMHISNKNYYSKKTNTRNCDLSTHVFAEAGLTA